MGAGTHEIPVELFEQNRKRLADRLRAREGLGNAIVLLQGGSDIPFYDTDTTYIFRQVRRVRTSFTTTKSDAVGFNIFAAAGSNDGQ